MPPVFKRCKEVLSDDYVMEKVKLIAAEGHAQIAEKIRKTCIGKGVLEKDFSGATGRGHHLPINAPFSPIATPSASSEFSESSQIVSLRSAMRFLRRNGRVPDDFNFEAMEFEGIINNSEKTFSWIVVARHVEIFVRVSQCNGLSVNDLGGCRVRFSLEVKRNRKTNAIGFNATNVRLVK